MFLHVKLSLLFLQLLLFFLFPTALPVNQNCSTLASPYRPLFRCFDGVFCLTSDLGVCDGVFGPDCADGSDHADALCRRVVKRQLTPSLFSYFRCCDGITKTNLFQVCDGTRDCPGGEDERLCLKRKEEEEEGNLGFDGFLCEDDRAAAAAASAAAAAAATTTPATSGVVFDEDLLSISGAVLGVIAILFFCSCGVVLYYKNRVKERTSSYGVLEEQKPHDYGAVENKGDGAGVVERGGNEPIILVLMNPGASPPPTPAAARAQSADPASGESTVKEG